MKTTVYFSISSPGNRIKILSLSQLYISLGQKQIKLCFVAPGELSKEMIRKSFLACGLTNAVDGSEDDEIHCLKPGQPCEKGCELLREHLKLLNTEEENPFVPDAEDIAACMPEERLVDEDHDSDEDVEVD